MTRWDLNVEMFDLFQHYHLFVWEFPPLTLIQIIVGDLLLRTFP
jgi:hypothetical protein